MRRPTRTFFFGIAMMVSVHVEAVEVACVTGGTCTGVDSEETEGSAAPFDAFAFWDNAKQEADRFFGKIFSDAEDEDTMEQMKSNVLGMFEEVFRGATDHFMDYGEKRGEGAGDSDSSSGNNEQRQEERDKQDLFSGLFKLFSSIQKNDSEESAMNLIQHAKDIADGDGAYETRTFQQTFNLFNVAFGLVKESLERSFGHLDFTKFNVFSYLYYLELEDERKTPSYKRRMHRFFKTVKPKEALELHDAFFLAELSYVDTVDEIMDGLNSTEAQWELVYAALDAHPGEPGHYLALKRRQSKRGDTLEVLLSVRGTKELGDLLSDAILDAVSYREGSAHAGVKLAGQYLVKKHINLLEKLLQLSDKKRIKLTLVGHSLGAGAAAIAAMEFNDYDFIDATAVGFGCPALLSGELAKTTEKYVLTVVADSDVVPRMSGPTVQNAVLDIMGYDWTDRAVRDVQQLIGVVRANTPIPISEDTEKTILDFVRNTLDKNSPVKTIPTERQETLLIPPGRCIHFYRDGASVSARHTPCNYFDAVEVTRTMIDDHLTPSGYHRLLLQFMRDYTNDQHFRFAHDSLF